MYGSVSRIGAAVPNEIYMELSPKIRVPNNPFIGFVHGAGATGHDILVSNAARLAPLTHRLCSTWEGVSGDNGGRQTWGNPASISALAATLNLAASSPWTSDTSYALIGNSMGAQVALNYAAQATVKPRAIVGVVPVINPNDIKINNRSGYGSLIDGAYGGNYSENTHGAAHNPYTMRNDAKLKNIPMLFFYGIQDTLCLPEYVEAFIAADPTKRVGIPVPFGHSLDAYAAVDHERIYSFLKENL